MAGNKGNEVESRIITPGNLSTHLLHLVDGAVHLDGLGDDAGEPVPAHAGYEGPPPACWAGGGERGGGGTQTRLGVGALPDDPGPGHGQGGVRHAGAGEERSVGEVRAVLVVHAGDGVPGLALLGEDEEVGGLVVFGTEATAVTLPGLLRNINLSSVP